MEPIDKYSAQGIGTALKGVIQNKGLTTREISQKLKKSPDWLDRIIRGQAKTFDVGLLVLICHYVEYPAGKFLDKLEITEFTPTSYGIEL